MNLRILFYFVTVFLASCSNSLQDEKEEIPMEIIDLELAVHKHVKMSDLYESIEYIVLEPHPESYIRGFRTNKNFLEISNERIVIRDNLKVSVFERNGKYLFNLSKQGKGPGEYTDVSSIEIDESNHDLYILTNGRKKILRFDKNGNFIEEFDLPVRSYNILIQRDTVYMANPEFLGKEFMISGFSLNSPSDVFNILPRNISGSKKGFASTQITRDNNIFSIWTYYSDAVWVGSMNSIHPEYFFKYDNKLPEKYILAGSSRPTVEELKKYKVCNKVVETSSKFYLNIIASPENHIIVEKGNLSNSKLSLVSSGHENDYFSSFITNDIDSTWNFWPEFNIKENVVGMYVKGNFLYNDKYFQSSFIDSIRNVLGESKGYVLMLAKEK